jgi:hypothetical protein
MSLSVYLFLPSCGGRVADRGSVGGAASPSINRSPRFTRKPSHELGFARMERFFNSLSNAAA